jgi:hypothetical protein
MNMKRLCVLFLLSVALCLPGCGGGGGGNGSGDALVSRYQALLRDVEDQDLEDTMSNYSFDYFHDCIDFDEEADFWDDLFSEPGLSIDIRDLDVTFTEIDGNEGYAEGSFIIRIDDDGDITEEEAFFEMFFRREDGVWRLYGDQECSGTPTRATDAKPTIGDMLGKKDKS